jgi:hypothetical protein
MERIMKLLVLCSFAVIFLSQTACNILVPDILKTTDPEIPEETLVYPEETTAPLETDWQMTLIPTQNITSEIPNYTSTPNPPNETEVQTQIPIPFPTTPENLLKVQHGSPVAISNFAHPELGCNWMGLAGQIIDIDNRPIKDMVVEVGGTMKGNPIFGLAVTGESSVYGPGGFEIQLGDEPISSDDTLWVVVYDLDGNQIISPAYFSTYSDCERNLIILNFLKERPTSSSWVYLPVILDNFSQP